MRDEWINQHIGAETEPRAGFENELAEQLADEWNGVSAQRVTLSANKPLEGRRPWRLLILASAAALILAVIVVSRTRGGNDSNPTAPSSITSPTDSTPDDSSPGPATTTANSTGDTTVDSTVDSTNPDTTSPGATNPDTTIVDTTTPDSAAAPETTAVVLSPPVTTPTTSDGQIGFHPACVESSRSGESSANLDEASLVQFGPLQAQPGLRITLPYGVAGPPFEQSPQSTAASAVRIPGGVLLNIRPSSYGSFPGSILSAIDDDGVVRWQRCFATSTVSVFSAPSATNPTEAVMIVQTTQPDGTGVIEHRLITLDDGRDSGTLADRLREQGVDPVRSLTTLPAATSPTHVLFAPPAELPTDARDRLIRLDLTTLTGESLPYPEGANETNLFSSNFRLDINNDPFIYGFVDRTPVAMRRFVDGAWTDEPSPLPASAVRDTLHDDNGDGVIVDFTPPTGEGPGELSATAADGSTMWTRTDIVSYAGEGFVTAQAGAVTVVRGCLGTYDPQNGRCTRPGVVGIRPSDGSTVWTLEGERNVSIVADDHALVSDEYVLGADGNYATSGWNLIDTDDGRVIDGQHWNDPTAFEQQCCGGSETVNVQRSGGVLVAVYERTVSVWYPRAADVTPHEVTIG